MFDLVHLDFGVSILVATLGGGGATQPLTNETAAKKYMSGKTLFGKNLARNLLSSISYEALGANTT